MRRSVAASPRIVLLLGVTTVAVAVAAASERLGAQAARSDGGRRAAPLAFVSRAAVGVTRTQAPAVPLEPIRSSALRRFAAAASASAPSETRRSRSRGARNGFLIGAAVGAVAGIAISDDFYNDPAANVAIGIVGFGFLGALVGAAVGTRAT